MEPPEQDPNVIKHWVDTHHLKNLQGQWTKDRKRVLTGSLVEKQALIRSMHDPLTYGHLGISHMVEFVERSYWWPRL